MSIRTLGGGFGGVIVVVIIIFVRMQMAGAKTAEFGEETKQDFLRLVAKSEVYQGDNRNYIDWLANSCHEKAWEANHDLEYRGRRRGADVIIDVEGYTRDMITAMIQLAHSENAPHIAKGLGDLHTQLFRLE